MAACALDGTTRINNID
ncbi:hypothetical protein RSAG8_04854, partial [Rhizoctonia solani AG-8 WAC10335]